MIAKFVGADRWTKDVEIALTEFPLVIGRAADARFQLNDRWVSRRHCEIDRVDGSLVMRDLGSTYGTLVNGAPVDETILADGDELSVGLSTFRIVYAPRIAENG